MIYHEKKYPKGHPPIIYRENDDHTRPKWFNTIRLMWLPVQDRRRIDFEADVQETTEKHALEEIEKIKNGFYKG